MSGVDAGRPPVEVRALAKRYRGRCAVAEVDLHVDVGEVVGLVGANGSGKSTVLKALAGLVRPSSGCALLLGRPLRAQASPAAVVGVQLDAVQPDDHVSGAAHLDLVRRWAGPRPDRRAELVDALGMQPYLDAAVRTYSTGMRRRLALVGALRFDPAVLLLDEPTSGLDPWAVDWLAGALAAHRAAGRSALVATHDLAWLAAVADRVVALADGRAWLDAPIVAGELPAALRQVAGR